MTFHRTRQFRVVVFAVPSSDLMPFEEVAKQ